MGDYNEFSAFREIAVGYEISMQDVIFVTLDLILLHISGVEISVEIVILFPIDASLK